MLKHFKFIMIKSHNIRGTYRCYCNKILSKNLNNSEYINRKMGMKDNVITKFCMHNHKYPVSIEPQVINCKKVPKNWKTYEF